MNCDEGLSTDHLDSPFLFYNHPMQPIRYWVFILLSIPLIFTSCSRDRSSDLEDKAWKLDQVRVLELPNLADSPYDLIAAYTRKTATDIEFRFDFLGSPEQDSYNFYLALDYQPGGNKQLPGNSTSDINWDLLFRLPSIGKPDGIASNLQPSSIRPRSFRSGVEDSITIRISAKDLPKGWENYQVQGFVSIPGSLTYADRIGPFIAGVVREYHAAPLALLFWESLPSATPAQALRRWNGAHTGPFGQRHGVSILLQAAEQYHVPVAILDLTRPSRLAALEAMDGLGIVQEMQNEGLLLLPDTAYGDPEASRSGLQRSGTAIDRYQLSRTGFVYGHVRPDSTNGYQAVFARQADTAHILETGKFRIIPLPESPSQTEDDAGPQGMSSHARASLLNAALSGNPDDLVVLGGELPKSAWADSLTAGPVFEDISRHPWIQPMDGDDLLTFPAVRGHADCPDLLCLSEVSLKDPETTNLEIKQMLASTADNIFSELGWQTYLELTDPTPDGKLSQLRQGYLGQIGVLASASQWAIDRQTSLSCATDLDWDGVEECVLSSKEYFFVIDPQGARLIFGAAWFPSGPAQVIGPRSQIIVGLGDPFDWHPEQKLAGDPEDIPGGFIDSPDPWMPYQVNTSGNKIIFTQKETGRVKIFSLANQELVVEITNPEPSSTKIPLLLLDDRAYLPGWYDSFEMDTALSNTVRWTTRNKSITVSAEGANLASSSFVDSLKFISQPEDPDFGYPPGHYTPFPMALVEVQALGNYTIRLSIHHSTR